jgi:hypothetical protein
VALVWQSVHGLAYAQLQLAALETQRAGLSLVAMMVAALFATLMLLGAYLGLQAVVVLTLVEQGLPASKVILLLVAANLLAVLVCCRIVRHYSRYLRFPALLCQRPAPQKTSP